jgi:6,7-dimethyl-8-ribityllumazine synthase
MTAGCGPRDVGPDISARDMRLAIVASRFNEPIVSRLLDGALDCLREHGATQEIMVIRVPGSWEIPVVARRLALGGQVDAVIALGVLIRGETLHFELIAREVARGLARAAEESGIPVTIGVIAAETRQQAIDRAGGLHGNRGREAARAAIETVTALRGAPTP